MTKIEKFIEAEKRCDTELYAQAKQPTPSGDNALHSAFSDMMSALNDAIEFHDVDVYRKCSDAYAEQYDHYTRAWKMGDGEWVNCVGRRVVFLKQYSTGLIYQATVSVGADGGGVRFESIGNNRSLRSEEIGKEEFQTAFNKAVAMITK